MTNIPLQIQLATLDSLALAFVLFDESGTPTFLSSQAAKLLDLTHRQDPKDLSQLLEPLAEVLRTSLCWKQASSNAIRSDLKNNFFSEQGTEIHLKTRNYNYLNALAYAGKLQIPYFSVPTSEVSNVEDKPKYYFAVMFHPTSHLEPFRKTLQTIYCTRSLFLLATCASENLDKSHLIDTPLANLYISSQRSTKEGNKQTCAQTKNTSRPIDLLPNLTLALSLTDPFLPDSIKVIIDAKTTALLDIDQTPFLQIASHLLLEGSDFIGLIGKMTVRTTLNPNQDRPSKITPPTSQCAEIFFFAERGNEHPTSLLNPLELYFYRQCLPVQYHVAIAEPEFMEKPFEPNNPNPKALLQNPTRNENDSVKEKKRDGNCLSPDTFSENLKVAQHISTQHQVTLHTHLLRRDLLAIHAYFPLSTSAVG